MRKLINFGIDMFSLEFKTWGKLINFGVDIFFLDSWNLKKWEN